MGEINVNYTVTYLAYFTPIILTALVVLLVIALRWFSYKERMALIAQGISPEDQRQKRKNHKTILAIGLVIGLIGLALTIGLITLGVGPWLLAGLLPLFVGLAFILVSLVLAPAKPKEPKQKPQVEPEITTVEEEDIEEEQENENSEETFGFTDDEKIVG
jgi:predicted tellurium resistance membrane protein TerC